MLFIDIEEGWRDDCCWSFFLFWHFILLKDFSELSEVVQKYSWMIILILSHFSRFETEFIKSRFSCQKENKIRLTAEHDKFLVKSACWNIVFSPGPESIRFCLCCPRVQDSVANVKCHLAFHVTMSTNQDMSFVK